MPYDSIKLNLQKIIFNDIEIDEDVDPKLRALAKALINKGLITKQEILDEL